MRTILNLLARKRCGKETLFKLAYPLVKNPAEFQFATPLKELCIKTFGLTYEQCYGDSSQRESKTQYTWGDVSPTIREKYGKMDSVDEYLSSRQVLQIIGTDLLRDQFKRDIWADVGVRAAVNSNATTCVFTDGRFPNEVTACRNVKQIDPTFEKIVTIRLYRLTGLEDPHESERALDSFDAVPVQREIKKEYYPILHEMGYQQVSVQLWERRTPKAFFDYLIDNNYTVEFLQKSLLYILEKEGILSQLSLS